VPPESPTLGFTHLQFEAMLTASRESANPCDFALVAMLGLLGPWIPEATSANVADLGGEHGHRVLRVCGKGTKIVLIPLRPPSAVPSAAEPRGRSCSTPAGPGWTATSPPAVCGALRTPAACTSPAPTLAQSVCAAGSLPPLMIRFSLGHLLFQGQPDAPGMSSA
jgi:hypothetical protein